MEKINYFSPYSTLIWKRECIVFWQSVGSRVSRGRWTSEIKIWRSGSVNCLNCWCHSRKSDGSDHGLDGTVTYLVRAQSDMGTLTWLFCTFQVGNLQIDFSILLQWLTLPILYSIAAMGNLAKILPFYSINIGQWCKWSPHVPSASNQVRRWIIFCLIFLHLLNSKYI